MRTRAIEEITLLSNEASQPLAEKIAAKLGIQLSANGKSKFQNGEILHHFKETPIEGQQVVIIGSNHNDQSHMELIDLIDGAHEYNAESINVVVPYLGYSTMERTSDEKREVVKGVSRTRQIFRAQPNFVGFLDLHAEAVMHAHDGSIKTQHLKTDRLVADKIRELGLENPVLVSPDYGRSKWVSKLAGNLNLPYAVADKDRMAKDTVSVSQVGEIVKGRVAIICDDMIRTGGTSAQAIQRCFEAGAKDVIFLATHLEMAGQAEQKLRDSQAQMVMGTDSHPNAKQNDFIKIYSVAEMIAEAITRHLNIK